MYMKSLPNKPTLADYQVVTKSLIIDRGFDKELLSETFMLFLEEAGEFAKAARKNTSLKIDKKSQKHDLEEEAADVFWMLLNLCNKLNIDLERAFRVKESKNQTRKWS